MQLGPADVWVRAQAPLHGVGDLAIGACEARAHADAVIDLGHPWYVPSRFLGHFAPSSTRHGAREVHQ
jgi:hypothetical protein